MVEKSPHARELAFAVNDKFLMFPTEVQPGHIEWNLGLFGKALQFGEKRAVLGLGPGLDGTFVQGLRFVWDHQIEIEINGIAKALATGTGSVGIVEGKQAWFGLFVADVIVLALEALAEA